MTEPAVEELRALQARFEDADPRDTLKWAFANIGRLAISVSMQASGVALVHMAREIVDRVPVLFLNTGFHFPETLAFRDRLVEQWGLELIESTPEPNPVPDLWKTDTNECCRLNKIVPMQKLKKGLDGYVTGIRRHQTAERAATRVISLERQIDGRSIYKVCPLVTWTSADVWRYVEDHDLPVHPLYERNYLSIGCDTPKCTRPVLTGEDERAGRWSGSSKTECGLHLADATHPADTSKPMDEVGAGSR